MRTTFARKKAIILGNIRRFFYDNRFCFLILLSLFLVGFATGVFVAIKKCDYLSVDVLNKFLIYKLLSGKINLILFLLEKFLYLTIIFIIVFFLARLKFSLFLFAPFMFFLTYYLGLLIATIITLFGFVGVLNCVLIILPFEIFILLLLIFYMVWQINSNKICFYYKNSIITKENIVFLGVLLAFIIFEAIFINLVSSTIIFVI